MKGIPEGCFWVRATYSDGWLDSLLARIEFDATLNEFVEYDKGIVAQETFLAQRFEQSEWANILARSIERRCYPFHARFLFDMHVLCM